MTPKDFSACARKVFPAYARKVFFAYTRDGRQFDGIEADSEATARADLAIKYRDCRTLRLADGSEHPLDGFAVREVAVPVGLFRDVDYLATRMSQCADPHTPFSDRILREFLAAHDRMMRALADAAGQGDPS
jgi:hypothetical protein